MSDNNNQPSCSAMTTNNYADTNNDTDTMLETNATGTEVSININDDDNVLCKCGFVLIKVEIHLFYY